ncbi:50S ribosomal protein L32 [bacterium (Candidatus Torokbacteria) CG_4_10_14_0_2_um_filter_35_8]|nr:MAG: 50S ribosomal protein L32 [bacterium (Candidatus Torokbacteria) CG_4_10_14_0_2_um_filter_35_8]
MAEPKKKTSHSRVRKRRSHQALKEIQYTFCSNCGKPVLPHRACLSCGFYKERKVFEIKVGSKAKKKVKKKKEKAGAENKKT